MRSDRVSRRFILDVKIAGLRATADPALLDLAAQQFRIVITHDRCTMTRYFRDRASAGKPNPGVFIVPQRSPIGEIIDSLFLVWTASQAEEWWKMKSGGIRLCICPSGEYGGCGRTQP